MNIVLIKIVIDVHLHRIYPKCNVLWKAKADCWATIRRPELEMDRKRRREEKGGTVGDTLIIVIN